MLTKQITLPSGLVVTIKKPGILALHRAFGTLPVLDAEATASLSAAESAERTMAWIRLLCACCVEPRLSVEEPPPPGTQFVDDVLDSDDYNALSAALTELMPKREQTEEVAPFSATAGPA